MSGKLEIRKQEVIDSVARLARDRLKAEQAGQADRFLRLLYANVPPDDLLEREPENILGAALSIWGFAAQRKPGEAKVRAFNPHFESHGWRSSHTVIEIVNDDMPFLVDSVTAEMTRRGLTVHLVIHPIVTVRRDAKGALVELIDADAKPKKPKDDVLLESVMLLEVSEQSNPAALRDIETGLSAVLADVRAAVEDWRRMRQTMLAEIERIEKQPPAGRPADELAEAGDFLHWVEDGHFTFLGYRAYAYEGKGKQATREVIAESGLGILRDPEVRVFDGMRELGKLPDDVRDYLLQPSVIDVVKTNRLATVHRPVHMDSIAVKRFDAAGKVVGEHRFVGLFTSVAYNQPPNHIPLLRRKVARILTRAGFPPASHDGKALVNILETFPRDELFQIGDDELFEMALGILHLQERQRIALFVRRDPFERHVSCLVYVPRDNFNTDLRIRIQSLLEKIFNGKLSAFYTQLSDSVLARIHFIIKTTRGQIPPYDVKEVEQRLIEVGRSWAEKLSEALVDAKGEEQGMHLFQTYGRAFPPGYADAFNAQSALLDIDRIEALREGAPLAMNLYRPMEAADNEVRFKVYRAGQPVPLSDILPMLEHMGLRAISEVPFEVQPAGMEHPVWIHDFYLQTGDGSGIDIGRVRANFQEAFAAVWLGEAEDDGFNRLVMRGGLTVRQATIVRAYAKYLKQTGFTFSQDYIEQTLAKYAPVARLAVDLFTTRFDPANQRDAHTKARGILVEIDHALDDVGNLDEDRILRRFVNLVDVTLRTNAFQPDEKGLPKPYISFKLDSRRIDELPLPRPMVEIWVYSPRVEAVHLRGGKVARGGIRWSDRKEDFRTEVLGLMKAQMVKNAVIVPVGSKGGFVVKRPPADASREALMEEVIGCYKIFMRGMLDITDNVKGAEIVPPSHVVRLDEDDPYLVVAADKGTATFSDIANSISIEYGFWLGDAFASGGSAGYDHKKMGITARGAWEGVKRHFREIGRDIQAEDFTVVGVGDMSGDVFGNGMLLSRHIRLIAAFNHLHIFIDPNPDPVASLAERQRLFDLARSSWTDYDAKTLSKGGAVFDRKAKSLKLSPEARAALGIAQETLTPNELMNAILKAEVDLLWFGGIGSYVKSRLESNAEVGDRANDAIRINGLDIRAKVVGEGANLGMTQRGRIEYAIRGGRLNTDFIDNSAGVDCSDHEVNIKILLGGVVQAGDMTEKQRNKLLTEMTEAVGDHVLRHNYLQTQAISIEQAMAPELLDGHTRLMRHLERAGKLDRVIEFLPDDETLADRATARQGLTRPELAILLSYSKISLYNDLLDSDLPDDPLLVEDLVRYFPERLRETYKDHIAQHRLRREIITTVTTNSMVNRVGSGFVDAIHEKTGRPASDIARAYTISREAFGLRGRWAEIEALDGKVPADIQIEMLLELGRLTERSTLWFLAHGDQPLDIAKSIAAFGPGIAALQSALERVMSPEERELLTQRAAAYSERGVSPGLATEVAAVDYLASAPDIVRIAWSDDAKTMKADVADVARIYFAVGARFGLDWLRLAAADLPVDTHWQKVAITSAVDDLYQHQSYLTRKVLDYAEAQSLAPDIEAIESWAKAEGEATAKAAQLLADLRSTPGGVDLAMLTVANAQIRALLLG
ncbi:NAD-glutamate dehydrogenase [Oceanibaculum pacificum]|uniref:NAD-glutamate dehydrogenase n=1 Tax=Oceanibaculum pacificum TaxID=580166 RepID=A0A154WH78_9PROT|nr:NAD-glutamate dehydrogenase [Oceanibaculum pacificum]KZD12867.1 NAD-glutamate dehydrogenase [Oceanibaculum pacificum]